MANDTEQIAEKERRIAELREKIATTSEQRLAKEDELAKAARLAALDAEEERLLQELAYQERLEAARAAAAGEPVVTTPTPPPVTAGSPTPQVDGAVVPGDQDAPPPAKSAPTAPSASEPAETSAKGNAANASGKGK